MSEPKISVFIPVKNEEDNIGPCLKTLAWADEVFVVDSQSTDRTVEEAESRGAKVVQFHFDGRQNKDDWALEKLPFRNEWVFYIDADERITPDLAEEIRRVVSSPDAKDGYYVNRRLIFMGCWVRRAGLYPSWTLRLFKHRLAKYEQVKMDGPKRRDSKTHEHLILDGEVGYLANDMLHRDLRDLYRYIERHNQYSDWDAEVYLRYRREPLRLDPGLHGSVKIKRFLKRAWVRAPLRPLLRFVLMYFLRLGFLDGAAGLHYCLLRAVHEYHISVKMKELIHRDRWLGQDR